MSDTESKLASKGKKSGEARQVRLKVRHLSVWSAVGVSFILGIAFGIVTVLVTIIGWTLLDAFGSFAKLDALITSVMGTSLGFSFASIFTLPTAIGFSLAISVLNVILFTIAGLIGALLYNLSVRFTGGLLAGFTDR
jgi:hypothetical protein